MGTYDLDVKPCSRCKQTLPTSSFGKNRTMTTGLRSECKPCRSEVDKSRAALPRERSTTEKCCPRCERVLEASSFTSSPHNSDGLHSCCRECTRSKRLVYMYNITLDQYREMAKNGCQITGCGSFNSLEVDHDHICCPGERSCGKCVRGVTCGTHNRGMGNFRDDPAALEAAAAYLRRYAALPSKD